MAKYLIDYYPLGWLRCEDVSIGELFDTQDPYVEELRQKYDMAKLKRQTKNGIIFAYNNSWWAEIEADSPKKALDKFFEELLGQGETVTEFADRCRECGKIIKQKYTDDMVAMLEEFDLRLSEYEDADLIRVEYIRQDIQEKIDALKTKGGEKE